MVALPPSHPFDFRQGQVACLASDMWAHDFWMGATGQVVIHPDPSLCLRRVAKVATLLLGSGGEEIWK